MRGTEAEAEKRAPITVKYEIPYFTVSGIQVRYLKVVEKSGYQALPWVRYITQNGDDYRCAFLLYFHFISFLFRSRGIYADIRLPACAVYERHWRKAARLSCRCNYC